MSELLYGDDVESDHVDPRSDCRPRVSIGTGEPAFRESAKRNHRVHFNRGLVRIATLLCADAATLAASLALVAWVLAPRFGAENAARFGAAFSAGHFSHLIATLLGLLISGSYGPAELWRSERRMLRGAALGLLFVTYGDLISNPSPRYLGLLACSTLVVSVAVAAGRRGVIWGKKRWLVPLKLGIPTVLVGGDAECIRALCRRELLERAGIDIVDIINAHETAPAEIAVLLQESGCEAALVVGEYPSPAFREIMRAAIATECQVLTIPVEGQLGAARPRLIWREGQALMEWRQPSLRLPQLVVKRTLDVLVSGALLVLLSPLYALIALFVFLEDGTPVLFRQRRLGLHGYPFLCLKFRSMYSNAEARLRSDRELYLEYVANDFKLPADRDSRITRTGRWLRRTSLDELPQFWNVLRGEMSLVGPRPIVPEEITHYSDAERLFLSIKPGVTGAWQVNGRSSVAYPQRASIELSYIENWSLTTDVGILLRTLPSVLAARGAH